MYELKRSGKIHDEIKLGDETIKIDIGADAIIQSYRKRQIELIKAEQQIKECQKQGIGEENLDASMEVYGKALVSLFNLVFGEEGTEKILKFYEGQYVEMAEHVLPYIVEHIAPQIQVVLDEQRARLKKKYVYKRGKRRNTK